MLWAMRPNQNDFKEALECGAAENIRQSNSNPSLLICKMGLTLPLTS